MPVQLESHSTHSFLTNLGLGKAAAANVTEKRKADTTTVVPAAAPTTEKEPGAEDRHGPIESPSVSNDQEGNSYQIH